MVDFAEAISAVAATSAAVGGTATWGFLKLLGLKRSRNGSRPITAAEAEACQKFQAQGYEHLRDGLNRVEKKQDHILDILIEGRK